MQPYLPHADSSNPFANLMRQAPMTADEYLHSALDHIDARLGAGYAKTHPELIAAFIQTCAMDYGAAIIAGELSDKLDDIARALHNLADVAGKMGPAFDGIADAIDP